MVPDVGSFLNAATVVVAPLRMGGGIRIKVIDALAFGKPTVATPLAAEGLNVSDRRELLLADDDEAFAGAVSALAFSDAPLREELPRRMRGHGRGDSERKDEWDPRLSNSTGV